VASPVFRATLASGGGIVRLKVAASKERGALVHEGGRDPTKVALNPLFRRSDSFSPARLPPAPGEPYCPSGYKGQNRKLDDLSVLLYEGVIGAQGPP
jgi:hypothetical protein